MSEPWKVLQGRVVGGHRIASGQAENGPYPRGALAMQKPFFKAGGLDLDAYYEGTINVSIAPCTFTVENPEFTFPTVEWTDRHPPENFSFSRCRLTFNETEYQGWVYYPDPATKKAHFQDPSVVEMIAPFVPGIKVGDRVKLALNTGEIRLSDPGQEESR
jgi:hypothetical protein